jgi:parallel beta-helix repeat protein
MGTRKGILALRAAASAAALLAGAVAVGAPADATHVACEDVIVTDTVLHEDLSCITPVGLTIGADGVTLDLNQHTIDGLSSGVGIDVSGRSNVTVMNGTVQDFFTGVGHTANTGLEKIVVTGLELTGQGSSGIDLDHAKKSSIRGNVVSQYGSAATAPFGIGIQGVGNVVDGNVVGVGVGPDDIGILIHQSEATRATRNHVTVHDGAGLFVNLGKGNRIERNVAENNAGIGIRLFETLSNRVSRNTSYLNGTGIVLEDASQSRVIDNIAASNLTDGISITGGSANRVQKNVSSNNGRDGIFVEADAVDTRLTNNFAVGNIQDGIDVLADSTTITRNLANVNGRQGIVAPTLTAGSDNTAFGPTTGFTPCQPDSLCGYAPPAAKSTVTCGQILTQDTVLGNDLTNCPDSGLVVDANGITIDLNGHTIDGQNVDSGIDNRGFDDLRIINGEVTQFDEGVLVAPAPDGSPALRNHISGIRADDNVTGSGIFLSNATPNADQHRVIANHVLDSGGCAIDLLGSGLNRVDGNVVTSNGSALCSSAPTSSNRIERNLFLDGGTGVSFTDAPGNRLQANLSAGNTGIGFYLGGTTGFRLIDNVAVDNGNAGFYLAEGSESNRLRRNSAVGNDSGIKLVDNERNQIIGNLVASNVGDGIFGFELDDIGNAYKANMSVKNGNAGLEVTRPSATLVGNVSNVNDLAGIAAPPGTSGQGNVALGNGSLPQCEPSSLC